jgi:hypothetical protein
MQCIKEGRSLKNDSINNINITEQVPSLPPVESQDTAYKPKSKVTDRYAMRAPGRARNNIKDGGSIDSNVTEGVPSLPPVESQDTAYKPKSKVTDHYAMPAPGRDRNNIKDGGGSVDSNVTEGVPSLPPVESQDTAYEPKSKVTNRYTMRAPGRARNNIKEGGIILEVPMDDEDDYFSEECHNWDNRIESYVAEQIPPHPPLALPPVQSKGFQHLYKSTKTTSSGQVLAPHKATIKHSLPHNDHVRRRDQKKYMTWWRQVSWWEP